MTTCYDGDDCPYDHDLANVDLCELWSRSMCPLLPLICLERHFYFEGEREKLKEQRNKDESKKASAAKICSKWLEGKCWGQNGWARGGEGCQYRHYYTEDDIPTATLPQDENVPSTSVLFSSPYVVKVMKEKESRRLEEVDLDTGRRRSWVETTEHDVIDLTGRTPAKARTPLSMLRVNTRTNIQPDGRRTPALDEKTLKSPLLSPASSLSPSEVRRYLDSRTRRSRRPSLRH